MSFDSPVTTEDGYLTASPFLHCKGVLMDDYIIEMLNITKEFPGIIANDNITLQLKKGEIHALLGRKRRREINIDEMSFRYL